MFRKAFRKVFTAKYWYGGVNSLSEILCTIKELIWLKNRSSSLSKAKVRKMVLAGDNGKSIFFFKIGNLNNNIRLLKKIGMVSNFFYP